MNWFWSLCRSGGNSNAKIFRTELHLLRSEQSREEQAYRSLSSCCTIQTYWAQFPWFMLLLCPWLGHAGCGCSGVQPGAAEEGAPGRHMLFKPTHVFCCVET